MDVLQLVVMVFGIFFTTVIGVAGIIVAIMKNK